jgi:hypothetical protein
MSFRAAPEGCGAVAVADLAATAPLTTTCPRADTTTTCPRADSPHDRAAVFIAGREPGIATRRPPSHRPGGRRASHRHNPMDTLTTRCSGSRPPPAQRVQKFQISKFFGCAAFSDVLTTPVRARTLAALIRQSLEARRPGRLSDRITLPATPWKNNFLRNVLRHNGFQMRLMHKTLILSNGTVG